MAEYLWSDLKNIKTEWHNREVIHHGRLKMWFALHRVRMERQLWVQRGHRKKTEILFTASARWHNAVKARDSHIAVNVPIFLANFSHNILVIPNMGINPWARELSNARNGRKISSNMHFINAKGILSAKNGMNIYRGCTHGCIYCDSRSDCYQMDHLFEDIAVKQNAPELLEDALRRKRKPCMVGTGSMCDPYMHCEETLGYTHKCLEIIDKYNCGVTVITKSERILRDIDLFEQINRHSKAVVQITLTTYDEALCRIIEPNVCTTKRRFEVLKECQRRGIPTVVWLCPILPYINDTEKNLQGILDYCFYTGVIGIINFGFGVTLRSGSREHFYQKLRGTM